jgi:SAM-dependent methyltransferase
MSKKGVQSHFKCRGGLVLFVLGFGCATIAIVFSVRNEHVFMQSAVTSLSLKGSLDKTSRSFLPEETFLPNACHQHLVREFPTLESLIELGKTSSMGSEDGEWSACTHLQTDVMHFAAFFARHLAYGLQPKSVLEFGCGLGTTSDFLARFVPGGSQVVCVDPEVMIGEIFGANSARRFPHRPLQLSMLSFAPEAQKCSNALFNSDMGFELVLSLEVAEHLPAELIDQFIQSLARATTKYLVFSAARPGQEGTGHIDKTMHTRDWWIKRFIKADRGPNEGKLHLLPQLSRGMRDVTGWADSAYDFGTNLVAFGAPGVPDISEIPQIAHDCSFYMAQSNYGDKIYPDEADAKYAKKHNILEYLPLTQHCEKEDENQVEKHEHWVEGQVQALWPELDLLIRRVKRGEIECSAEDADDESNEDEDDKSSSGNDVDGDEGEEDSDEDEDEDDSTSKEDAEEDTDDESNEDEDDKSSSGDDVDGDKDEDEDEDDSTSLLPNLN